jgi:hypothetical protein
MNLSISRSAAYHAYYGDTFLDPRDFRPCLAIALFLVRNTA